MSLISHSCGTHCDIFIAFCSVVDFFGRTTEQRRKPIVIVADLLAILIQLTAFVVWPLVSQGSQSWLIPISVCLISFRWWENYVTDNSSYRKCSPLIWSMSRMSFWCFVDQTSVGLVRWISEVRENLTESRYYIYLYVAPTKILLFVTLAATFTNLDVVGFYENAFDWWNGTFTFTVYDVCQFGNDYIIFIPSHTIYSELYHI